MSDKRKFSIFVSSTYEDLKDERQATMGVALENDFIPVGMEQFHAAPVDQWSIITKMIDECDFYLLIIGGCYGTIEESTGISYTEKEYNYAKAHSIPVCALIRNTDGITEAKMDPKDCWAKQEKLSVFRNKVKTGGNTVDFYDDINDLRYKLSASLRRTKSFATDDAGWVRYKDVQHLINERIGKANIHNEEQAREQANVLSGMQTMLQQFGEKLQEIKENQLTWEDIPVATEEDIEELFKVED